MKLVVGIGGGLLALMPIIGCESSSGIQVVGEESELPECNESAAGAVYLITESGRVMVCADGGWQRMEEPAPSPTPNRVETTADLPMCDSTNEGLFYFISDLQGFFLCASQEWTAFVGEKGDRGETGPGGVDGANGADGTDYEDAVVDLIAQVQVYGGSVLWIYCTDGSTTWSGTGTKISSTQIITADHVMDSATSCLYYSGPTLVGSGWTSLTQLGARDVIIIEGVSLTTVALH